MLIKAISASVVIASGTAAGGWLFSNAAHCFGWSLTYIVAGAALSFSMSLAFCLGKLRACVALGCFGCILQPSLLIAPACDGQMVMWPIVGAAFGFVLGALADCVRSAIVS